MTEALSRGLGTSHYEHKWQSGQQDNLYLAYLALADVLVVTGESESMLAEAAASGKPVYIYPLPKRSWRPSLKTALKGWVITHAQACPVDNRGPGRFQQRMTYLCIQLITQGIVLLWRDLIVLHRALIRSGIARPFGAPLETGKCLPLQEIDEVARKVRTLLGVVDS